MKHKVILNANYDTHASKRHSNRFVRDFKRLPKAAVIAIAVKDEAQRSMTG